MELNLPVSQETLSVLSRLDRFRGAWPAESAVAFERLDRLSDAARIQSIGASCRLAGLRVSDVEVVGLVRGEALPLRDSAEVLGYGRAIDRLLPSEGRLLTVDDLGVLHAVMMGAVGDSVEPSPWRQAPLHREAFDAEGRATGRVFTTLPPRLAQEKTEEALTWLELELRGGERHPVLVIGAFVLVLLAISPYERGSGRLARLLAGRLLHRTGYAHLPYASLESEIELMREEHYDAFDKAQTKLWTPEGDLAPWLAFFLETLDRHRERVEVKLDLERRVVEFPPLQRTILEMVREHGSVNAALLLEATGANRNTLKDNLRRLVDRGLLEKTGERRGTRYRLGTAPN